MGYIINVENMTPANGSTHNDRPSDPEVFLHTFISCKQSARTFRESVSACSTLIDNAGVHIPEWRTNSELYRHEKSSTWV